MLKASMIVCVLSASSASAATMTFNQLYDYANDLPYYGSLYTEDGITVTGNDSLGQFSSTSLHMDDFYGGSSSRVVFTMASRFNAIGFDFTAATFDYYQCDPFDKCTRPTYQNVMISGFRGSAPVASLLFDMGDTFESYPLVLGNSFNGLTSLAIQVFLPDTMTTGLPTGYAWGCGNPCSHFTIDNMTLAPVPLPPTLLLVSGGLGLMGVIVRRRRKDV